MDAYASWDLFLIFCSILVLVSGVVLLTHKKPDHAPASAAPGGAPGAAAVAGEVVALSAVPRSALRSAKAGGKDGERVGLREDGPADVVWDVGDASDDDEEDDADGKNGERTPVAPHQRSERHAGEEGVGLMMDQDRDVERGIALEESRNSPVRRRRSTSSSLASSFARSSRSSSDAEGEEYGAFTDARS